VSTISAERSLSSSKSFTSTAVSQEDESVPAPRLRDTQLVRMAERIREDLRKEATFLTAHSVLRILELYTKRQAKSFAQ